MFLAQHKISGYVPGMNGLETLGVGEPVEG